MNFLVVKMTKKDNFKNRSERARLTPKDPVIRFVGFDYKGEPVTSDEAYIDFFGDLIKFGDERDYILSKGGEVID
jgi:hypothetical protein